MDYPGINQIIQIRKIKLKIPSFLVGKNTQSPFQKCIFKATKQLLSTGSTNSLDFVTILVGIHLVSPLDSA